MTAVYPLPKNTRQTDVLAGTGAATYGPFGFSIFDVADVLVKSKAAGQAAFVERTDVVVLKTTVDRFATFTVTFPAAVPSSTSFVVTGRRKPERSSDVLRGNTLNSLGLETELSRIVVTQQELRRDVDGQTAGVDAERAERVAADAALGLRIDGMQGAVNEAAGRAETAAALAVPAAVSAASSAVRAEAAAVLLENPDYGFVTSVPTETRDYGSVA